MSPRALLVTTLTAAGLAAGFALQARPPRSPATTAAVSSATPLTKTADASPIASAPAPVSTGTLEPPYPLPSPLPEECMPVAFAPGEPCPLAPPGSSYRRVFGRAGTAPGEFVYPRAITATSDGGLYVVDKRGRIQALDSELRPRALVRVPHFIAGSPTGLAVSATGKLIVADTHYTRVLTYSKDLALESSWGRGGSAPGGFKLLKEAREGPDGRLYTLDYSTDLARIQVWKGGALEHVFGCFGVEPAQFRRPMGLAVDGARGELLVADAENHRIQVLGLADGAFRRSYGSLGAGPGQLRFPYDVSVDEDGRAWVAEFGNHRLQVFDREGRSVGLWGSPGRRAGEVAEPWGVALAPRGLVYLLDSGNDRIYELDRAVVLAGH